MKSFNLFSHFLLLHGIFLMFFSFLLIVYSYSQCWWSYHVTSCPILVSVSLYGGARPIFDGYEKKCVILSEVSAIAFILFNIDNSWCFHINFNMSYTLKLHDQFINNNVLLFIMFLTLSLSFSFFFSLYLSLITWRQPWHMTRYSHLNLCFFLIYVYRLV